MEITFKNLLLCSSIVVAPLVSNAQAKKPVVVKTGPTTKTVTIPSSAAAPVIKLTSLQDSASYALGLLVASNFKSQNVKINSDLMAKAFAEVMKGEKTAFSDMQANGLIQKYMQGEQAKQYEPNRLAGIKFLEENKKKEGVITTASGLQYQIIKAGDGPKPTATDKVKTHYHGTLLDGTVFDSSVQRGEPISFPVNGVIQGWVEALQLMPVGSKWKLFIPQELAYGPRGSGGTIKPYSALVFEVELLGIEK